ncbi:MULTISPECIES: LysR family transcriptional regulator [unclassified Streptomyces]|uniref:LysR family transcriptional regulator n=1 Tax=unclassified Streptomyces TaxID=2593676 RepID=UPI00332C00CE
MDGCPGDADPPGTTVAPCSILYESGAMANLQQLRTLHTVRSHGGIHAAAKALHLSPSAVSQQIKSLSSECGFALVEPEGRGIRLTDEGSIIAEVAARIADLWQTSVARHQTPSTQPQRRPTIALGAFPSAMGTCVLPALRGEDQLPFHLQLFETAPCEGRDLVKAGILQAAVSVKETDGLPVAELDGLHTVPLRHEPFVLVGPPGLVSMAIRCGPEALSGFPWVLPRVGSDCDRLISTHLARHGVLVRPVGRTDDWNLSQDMALALSAVTYVPASALVRREGLSRSVDGAGIPAPSRTVVLVADEAAAVSSWFIVLEQRFKRTCARMSGALHGS